MTNPKSIFISRSLGPNSPLRKVAVSHSVTDLSLIKFSPLEFDDPESDWIFFYSRNAVRYFFENKNYELYPYQYACMSSGTADELNKYILDISFVGNGKPEEVARQFHQERKPYEKVCFIRAKNSMDSVYKLVGMEQDFSTPVYNNIAIDVIPTVQYDILIFTSPMNADAWFAKNKYIGQPIIVIGSTTKAAVLKYSDEACIVASEPSEVGIADALSRMLSL